MSTPLESQLGKSSTLHSLSELRGHGVRRVRVVDSKSLESLGRIAMNRTLRRHLSDLDLGEELVEAIAKRADAEYRLLVRQRLEVPQALSTQESEEAAARRVTISKGEGGPNAEVLLQAAQRVLEIDHTQISDQLQISGLLADIVQLLESLSQLVAPSDPELKAKWCRIQSELKERLFAVNLTLFRLQERA